MTVLALIMLVALVVWIYRVLTDMLEKKINTFFKDWGF